MFNLIKNYNKIKINYKKIINLVYKKNQKFKIKFRKFKNKTNNQLYRNNNKLIT